MDTASLYIGFFRILIKSFLFAALLNFSLINIGVAQTDPLQQLMQSRMVQLRDSHALSIDGRKIAAVTLIPELYTKRHFNLAWQDGGKRDELIEIIRHIDTEGLNPEDYLLSSLLKYHGQDRNLTDADRVDFDIL